MIKRFFDRDFEFGGTLRDLNESKGNYYGVYIFVLPSDFGKVDFNETANLEKWRDRKVAVSIDELQSRWLKDADVLYIGKSESKTVYKKVLKHLKFWVVISKICWKIKKTKTALGTKPSAIF